jgi:hypothetical protein
MESYRLDIWRQLEEVVLMLIYTRLGTMLIKGGFRAGQDCKRCRQTYFGKHECKVKCDTQRNGLCSSDSVPDLSSRLFPSAL